MFACRCQGIIVSLHTVYKNTNSPPVFVRRPMEISIKTLRNDARNGGITAPSGTGGAADNIFESLLYQTCLKCLTMDSFKSA